MGMGYNIYKYILMHMFTNKQCNKWLAKVINQK